MTKAERAQQIWQVLVSAASNRQVLTYGLVADRIGMGPGTLAGPLGCIMNYCEREDLPPLTVLVVGKGRGTPGHGLATVTPSTQDREREAVFAFNWFSRLPPTSKQLSGG